MQGLNETALHYSAQAVDFLEQVGTMPTLRTEEVIFNHYLALKANNREQEAIMYLKKAYSILNRKSESIKDVTIRRKFQERVPISKAILAAVNASTS